MRNFQFDKATNKFISDRKDISLNQKGLEVLWILASQPTKTFSSNDILDVIIKSGLMIHEKQFAGLLAQSIRKKSEIQMKQKNKHEKHKFKNKFMNKGFKYL